MMRLLSLPLVLSLALQSTAKQATDKSLAKEDQQLLQAVLRDFLFDPEGTERVEIRAGERDSRFGWMSIKNRDWVFFTDGDRIPAPKDRTKIAKVNFIGKCREAFAKWEAQRAKN